MKTMKREVAAKFLDEMILGSTAVQEVLLINRSRLGALVDEGKLKPIKSLKREHLFFKPDVDALKAEMLKDSRSNLFKQGALKNAQ